MEFVMKKSVVCHIPRARQMDFVFPLAHDVHNAAIALFQLTACALSHMI